MSRLDVPRQVIEASIAKLDEEREKLVGALESLGGKAKASGRRGPGRPRGSKAKASTSKGAAKAPKSSGRKRRRRKGGPTRLVQVLQIVSDKPGIQTNEVADALGMKPNYLYRLKSDAEKEGLLQTDGRKLNITAKGREEIANAASGSNGAKANGSKAKAGGSKSKRGGRKKAAAKAGK